MNPRKNSFKFQSGATAVEMALVMIFVVQLMLGIVDFSRWLFTMNSANEATRLGARIAAVCTTNAAGIKTRMRTFLPPSITNSQITVSYLATGCATGEVCAVQVALTGSPTIASIAWFLPTNLPIPSFTTLLPRESLQTSVFPPGGTAAASNTNPLCS
jgi:Flp pilus assembly protein TadG